MECSKTKKLLSEYLDGILDGQMKKLVEEHLRGCKNCSEELESLKGYVQALSSLEEVKAPEDFLERVHERIRRRQGFEKVIHKLFLPLRIKVPLEFAGVAVTAILIIHILNVMQPVTEIAGVSGRVEKPIELALLIKPEVGGGAYFYVNGDVEAKLESELGGGEIEAEKGEVRSERFNRERRVKEEVDLKRLDRGVEKQEEVVEVVASGTIAERETEAYEPAEEERDMLGYRLDKLADDEKGVEITEEEILEENFGLKDEPVRGSEIKEKEKRKAGEMDEALTLKKTRARSAPEELQRGIQPVDEAENGEKGVIEREKMEEAPVPEEAASRIALDERLGDRIEGGGEVAAGISKEAQLKRPDTYFRYCNEMFLNVKDLVQSLEGKVISVEYEEKTNLPQFITAQVPAKNYSALLDKLGQIGELRKPLPSITAKGEKPLQLRINLISRR